ncbi:MAG: alanine--tRNA ligase [Candidatus Yanofskybacteria bacterium]|nr:alanine--tRNA ligase [Candidatus Yanofskybacteria bacterium]
MTHQEIRQKFLDYFKSKGHTIVPSSSLLPDDPSVLFTTAGMQQFKPYYIGKADAQKDFGGLNTASIQKCIRTSDIDEVGDERHLTFFEMLGNFSFGGYFKKEAIEYAHEFITKEMNLTIDYVSIFGGEDNVPADEESEEIWKSLDPAITVKKFGRADNFWGPTGEEGPCGPTTEVYVNGIEIWNVVFNQYFQHKDKTLEPLKTPGIDTGMGLERLAMVVQKVPTVFETDLFKPIMQSLHALGSREQRIVADHARAAAFLITDGVRPSNKDQGYVLRRLLRRLMLPLSAAHHSLIEPFEIVIEKYDQIYPGLDKKTIVAVVLEEENKFSRTVAQGLKEINKLSQIDASTAFKLYESFGLPYEVIKDIAGEKASALNRAAFEEEFKKHQEKSRAGAEKKFGGHGLLLDTGELKAANEEELKKVTRLHTATHLLQAALRKVLGEQVHQAGSDITVERTRFDFIFDRKLTSEELQQVEALMNEIIDKDMPVKMETLPKEDAEKTGALYFFKEKYPDPVNVYYTGDSLETAFSKEFCGGPHVTHTGEIGHVKIIKEEAVSAGVRRIRATVQ